MDIGRDDFHTTVIGESTPRAPQPFVMETSDPSNAQTVVEIVSGLGEPKVDEIDGSPTPLVVETIKNSLRKSRRYHDAVVAEQLPTTHHTNVVSKLANNGTPPDLAERMASDKRVKRVKHKEDTDRPSVSWSITAMISTGLTEQQHKKFCDDHGIDIPWKKPKD